MDRNPPDPSSPVRPPIVHGVLRRFDPIGSVIVLYLLRYTMGPDAAERVPEVYPRHRAYLDRFAAGGDLLLIGPVRPIPTSGALSVFRTREAAEAFPKADPFVLEGVAVPADVEEWDALEFR